MKRMGLMIAALGFFFFAQVAYADWTPTKRITWTSGDSIGSAIAIDPSNAIHVVWYDFTPGNSEIYYKSSTDGGTTWTAAKRLTWTSGSSWYPQIAIDSGGKIHVVWFDNTPGNYEIYYKGSADGGETWSLTKRLTWTSGDSADPAMAMDSSNTIHVVWHDLTPGNSEIYYKSSADGGATWTAAKRITLNSGGSIGAAIAIDSINTVHVFWRDDSPGNYEIYYKRGADGGTTWGSVQRLTTNSGFSHSPAVAIDSSSAIHVVWSDNTPGNNELYYKRSTDGGTTWSTEERLTWTTGESQRPDLAIEASDTIYLVWHDDTPGNLEVYYKRSIDGGTAWSSAQRLTSTTGDSRGPRLAVDLSDIVHIVWSDDTPGNSEIYYKNGH